MTPAYGELASELGNFQDARNFLASPPPTPTSGLSQTPEEPGFGRLSPEGGGRRERPNLLRPRGSTGASLGPASRDQARKVIPEPRAKGLGRNKNPPHLNQEGRRRAHEPAPQHGFQRPFPSSSSCPPKSRARLAPIGQQSRPPINTLSSSSSGRLWLNERRSHWLALRKPARWNRARGGLVQLVKS